MGCHCIFSIQHVKKILEKFTFLILNFTIFHVSTCNTNPKNDFVFCKPPVVMDRKLDYVHSIILFK